VEKLCYLLALLQFRRAVDNGPRKPGLPSLLADAGVWPLPFRRLRGQQSLYWKLHSGGGIEDLDRDQGLGMTTVEVAASGTWYDYCGSRSGLL
jgi:hypothetical protein